MVDRIDAVGGELRIEAEPGHGVRIVGRLPVESAA
jgi:signal transduction histidine kinase